MTQAADDAAVRSRTRRTFSCIAELADGALANVTQRYGRPGAGFQLTLHLPWRAGDDLSLVILPRRSWTKPRRNPSPHHPCTP